MRYFVKRSQLIKAGDEKGIVSHMLSAQYDGLVEVRVIGDVVPQPVIVPRSEENQ